MLATVYIVASLAIRTCVYVDTIKKRIRFAALVPVAALQASSAVARELDINCFISVHRGICLYDWIGGLLSNAVVVAALLWPHNLELELAVGTLERVVKPAKDGILNCRRVARLSHTCICMNAYQG